MIIVLLFFNVVFLIGFINLLECFYELYEIVLFLECFLMYFFSSDCCLVKLVLEEKIIVLF